MVIIAHEAVEVLSAPQSAATSQIMIDEVGRARFPTLHHVAEREAKGLFDDDMHVVRHDAPGNQTIAFAIGVKQGSLDCIGAMRIPQHARAVTGVE